MMNFIPTFRYNRHTFLGYPYYYMINPYHHAKFTFSANALQQLPKDSQIEIAFAGRSNAGKSSALNTLTQQKSLARVSKTPGRTQLINYFSLAQAHHYLVDLPGYGYAKVPEHLHKHWEQLLSRYLLQREALRGVILIMDSRHPMKQTDIQLLECCASRNLPTHILLNKIDKLSQNQAQNSLRDIQSQLKLWRAEFSVQTFSSLKKIGLNQLINKLNQWFSLDNSD